MASNKQEQMREMRKQQAQDLRKAHFYLGFDQGFNHETRYNQFYKPYELGAEKTKQEMLKLRSDLRSTHYVLGTDAPSKLFTSTATDSFQKPLNPEISKLSQETKKDLRSHHFTLGNHKDSSVTDYTRNFDSKGVNLDALKDRVEQANVLRKHNHDFGDPKDYYSSLYNENYNNSYDPQFLHQGKSKEVIQQEIINLRKTNLVMGNHTNPNYNTEANSEFNSKPQATRAAAKLGLRQTHFTLGEDKNNFNTQVQNTYKGLQLHQHDPSKIKALSKDLRAEHFSMGNDARQFTSEAAERFKDIDRSKLTKTADMAHLYRTHFNQEGYGGVNPVQHYVSSYNNQYNEKGAAKTANTRNDRADRNSHIVLGSDQIKDQFVSEATNNFVNFQNSKPSTLDAEVKDNLRKHHYEFGTDKPGYKSEAKEMFVDKTKDAKQSKLDPNLIKDLRKNHFEYGTQKNQFNTSTGDIGKNQGKPSKLDPALAKDLRSHHFSAADPHSYYNSSYKLDYRNYEEV